MLSSPEVLQAARNWPSGDWATAVCDHIPPPIHAIFGVGGKFGLETVSFTAVMSGASDTPLRGMPPNSDSVGILYTEG